MSSIIIAIQRDKMDLKKFEDVLVEQLQQVLGELNYKKIGEIDDRDVSGCSTDDRRLRFRQVMIGEKL